MRLLRLRSILLCAIVTATMTTVALTSTSANAAPPGAKSGGAPNKEKPPPPPADVETAEQLFTKLDYDKANDVAERVVKQRGLTHDQLTRAYRVLAVTYAILDKEDSAKDAFLQLLVFDQEYTVDPNLGPKVSQPFMEARGQFRSLPSKPGIEVIATVRTDGGQLRVTTRDPTHIAKKVSVGYRWTSSGDYTISQVNVGDGTVEVTPATGGRTRLDFYAQALDDRDNAVLEAGSPQVPKSAFAEAGAKVVKDKPEEKSSGSVFSSPFFWIFTSAAVIGGATALFFVLRPEDPPSKASLSPVIRCGADLCK